MQIKLALKNFKSAKLRSLLAVLGIMVGTASVVALVTCGNIATERALAQLKSLGTDLISIRLVAHHEQNKQAHSRQLNLKDVTALKAHVPGITEVAAFSHVYASRLIYQGRTLDGIVVGVNTATQNIFKFKMQAGAFLSDLDAYEHYCVIGDAVAKQIQRAHPGPVLNQQVKMGQQVFTVIGVLAYRHGHTFFPGDENRAVFVPIKGVAMLSQRTAIDALVLRILPDINLDKLKTALQNYFKMITPDLKIFMTSPRQIIERMESQSQIFTWLLGVIGGISLLVGGIGVMNIMLVSVTERKQEIGIRKAVGARPADIQKLFLTESILLTLFGGTLGVGLGLGAAYIICQFAHWVFAIYMKPIVIGFAVSALTGVFFGFYPARRASKLDPIAALRDN